MSNGKPQIGFDRHLELAWLDAVASWAAAGVSEPELTDRFADLLATIDQGTEANRKNRTVLAAVWLRVPDELREFHQVSLELLATSSPSERIVIHFGRCMAAYPFFAYVTSQAGRLLGLQGSVASTDIYRRVAERYGDRSRARRSAQHVLSTLTSWELLSSIGTGLYTASPPLPINDADLAAWVLEAYLRSGDLPRGPLSALTVHPVFFPFAFGSLSIGSVLRANPRLDSIQQGLDEALLTLAV